MTVRSWSFLSKVTATVCTSWMCLTVYQQYRLQTSAGQQSFSFYGSTVWNSELAAVRDKSLLLNALRRKLKTCLFGQYQWRTASGPAVAFFCILSPTRSFASLNSVLDSFTDDQTIPYFRLRIFIGRDHLDSEYTKWPFSRTIYKYKSDSNSREQKKMHVYPSNLGYP